MNTSWEALATTPAAAVVAPARQGWLQQYRRGAGVVRGWKCVFCVLVGEALCEYAGHDAPAPARVVALRGARVVLPSAATDRAASREGAAAARRCPHNFFVDTPAGEQLWLAAETDQDARAWATALRDAAGRHAHAAAGGAGVSALSPAPGEGAGVAVAVPCAFCCERCEGAAVAALDRVLGGDGAGGWRYELERSSECVRLIRTSASPTASDIPQQVVEALRDAGFFANIVVVE